MIDYRFHIEEDTYVVWIAVINRYLQLKKPAFRVFEQWVKNEPKSAIAKTCSAEYSLPEDESIRFVDEITGQIQKLLEAGNTKSGIHSEVTMPVQYPEYLSVHFYSIGNHFFKFLYRDEYLKDLFHPIFCHQETDLTPPAEYTFIELYSNNDIDGFRVDNSPDRTFSVKEIDGFQGAVFMEILNAIHGMSVSDWMGVIHASAVTDGTNAVIFTAPSGSGKTSIALLMLVSGFRLLSDDFVPVALHEPEIYHFPSGISVKKGAISFLKEYFPQLKDEKYKEQYDPEVYLPLEEEPGVLINAHTKAIVFIKYDPTVDYDLKKESNLDVMNQLITQSWIAGTPEAAERFLTWYFKLPVYTLRYSNNRKAVEGMRELFS